MSYSAAAWQVRLASRTLSGGVIAWTSAPVGLSQPSSNRFLDPAISLAYSAGGRAAVACVGPSSDTSSDESLWVAIETAPQSGLFSRTQVDGPGIGAVSAAFDSQEQLWVAYTLRGDLASSNGPEEAVVRTATLVRGATPVVVQRGSLPAGLFPSIAVDPITDEPAVAYLSVEFGPSGGSQVASLFARWSGSAWNPPELITDDGYDALPAPTPIGAPPDPDATPTPIPFPQSENANVLAARTSLRYTAEGTARFAHARPSGGVFLSTQPPGGTWSTDLLETSASPGATLGMVLSGDSARIGYFDRRSASLRFYDEDDGRKLDAQTPPTACSRSRYETRTFTPSAASFIAAHNDFDFVFTSDSFTGLGGPELTDVFVTALTRDTTRIRAVTGTSMLFDREDFILVPAPASVPSPSAGVNPIQRFEYSNFPNSPVGVGVTRARIRARVTVLLPFTPPTPSTQLIELATDDDITNPTNSANICACPASNIRCCDTAADCDLSVVECNLPIPTLPNFPPPPTDIGREIRDLAKTLPLIPARQDASGGQVTATLQQIELQLRGLDLAARGDGISAGTIDLDLPVQQFHADAHVSALTVYAGCLVPNLFSGGCAQSVDANITQLCGAFDVGVSNVSAGVRIRIEGPPTAVSREGSARYGMPILAGPKAFGIVSGGLNVDLGRLDNCLDKIEAGTILIGASPLSVIGTRAALEREIKSTIESKISGRLKHPDGNLGSSLNELARSMNSILAGPWLEHILVVPSPVPFFPRVDARNAVVVDVTASGDIRAVFEKPRFLP